MAKRKSSGDGLVYSTDPDRMKARVDAPTSAPVHASVGPARVVVRRENKGRRGKTVTTISGLALDPLALAALARELKQSCGAGGTAKDGVIEVQGDRVARVLELLRARGFDARVAGG